MDWDGLRLVLALGREGSLSRAAEALDVTHTTVGRRLERLEDDLGVRVFDRTPDGYVATDAGAELLEVATSVEGDILQIESRVRGQDTALAGTLRVSTLDMVFEALVDVFASFQARYPGVDLTVTSTETEVSLFRRQADVALRMTNTPPDTLIGRRIGAVRFGIYGHRDLVGDPATADLSALPWLHWDERLDEVVRWMDSWLGQIAPGAPIALRLGENTLTRRAAIRAGLGLHPLPIFEGERFPELVRVGPTLEPFTRQLWLLTLPALKNTRRVRVFLDHVAQQTRNHPALQAPGSPG